MGCYGLLRAVDIRHTFLASAVIFVRTCLGSQCTCNSPRPSNATCTTLRVRTTNCTVSRLEPDLREGIHSGKRINSTWEKSARLQHHIVGCLHSVVDEVRVQERWTARGRKPMCASILSYLMSQVCLVIPVMSQVGHLPPSNIPQTRVSPPSSTPNQPTTS